MAPWVLGLALFLGYQLLVRLVPRVWAALLPGGLAQANSFRGLPGTLYRLALIAYHNVGAACWLIGLWPETMSTFALVISATCLALALALPIGVLAGFLPRLDHVVEPILDLIQTMPPYIYLLPAIALLGFGPATALAATLIVAMPPAIRLTSLGIRMTPREFVELGQATGMTNAQMFFKIRLPFALPSIMAGINQSLMMAFGMVVIAGIVGSGGLGETIYEAIRTLDIGKSIDAAIAIVILTIVIDRLTQNLAPTERDAS